MTDIAIAASERSSAGSEAAMQLALTILAAPHRYSDAAVGWAEIERNRRAVDAGVALPGEAVDR